LNTSLLLVEAVVDLMWVVQTMAVVEVLVDLEPQH
jgi:hypothetical protein